MTSKHISLVSVCWCFGVQASWTGVLCAHSSSHMQQGVEKYKERECSQDQWDYGSVLISSEFIDFCPFYGVPANWLCSQSFFFSFSSFTFLHSASAGKGLTTSLPLFCISAPETGTFRCSGVLSVAPVNKKSLVCVLPASRQPLHKAGNSVIPEKPHAMPV